MPASTSSLSLEMYINRLLNNRYTIINSGDKGSRLITLVLLVSSVADKNALVQAGGKKDCKTQALSKSTKILKELTNKKVSFFYRIIICLMLLITNSNTIWELLAFLAIASFVYLVYWCKTTRVITKQTMPLNNSPLSKFHLPLPDLNTCLNKHIKILLEKVKEHTLCNICRLNTRAYQVKLI